MNRQKVARELVGLAKELTAAKKTQFDKVKPGTSFKYKGKTYWKASRTRACLQKDMKAFRPDDEVDTR